ncbi:hypothetical protein [Chelativorans sp. Marseille-P2723]|uniref:hypothetical protein n=1 Tax=Chelativorans sp. Marseille-P2723 TaxID=2709133 RepID=UPI00156EEB1F|nr:hypothetical protein [Chelativorans sp. Marseille-P2723]
MTGDKTKPLRLKWSRTWPDKSEDFVCHADGVDGPVGRIYSSTKPGAVTKHWHWAVNGYLPDLNVHLSNRGVADTKDEAARAVEAAYFRVRRNSA